MADVELKVGGKIYSGWTAMRAQRGLEQAAGAFTLELTERWPGQPQRWSIEPGAKCQLLLEGTPVITGYVDKVERSLSASSHAIQVSGRDAAADLGDCSACTGNDCRTDALRNQSLLQVAQALAGQYGVAVSDAAGVGGRIPAWRNGPGKSVWEVLSAGARQFAVYLMSDGLGGLVITRAGQTRHPARLVQGENILSARFTRDDSQRYWRYILRGQSGTDGSIGTSAEMVSGGEAIVIDDSVRKPRTLIFQPEISALVTLKDRAQWERNHRRGMSRRLEVTVQGWSALGQVWRPNEMVTVDLPIWGLEAVPLLIVSVDQSLSSRGRITQLTLAPREAYDLLPEGADNSNSDSLAGLPQEALELLQ